MRITQESMVASQLARLTRRLTSFERAQAQLGSGKVVARPSDDPAVASRVLLLRSSLRARQQEVRAAGDARTWLDSTDAQLQAAVTRLHRARDLMVRAGNTSQPTERQAVAVEIAAVRDELVAIANTEHAGRPLFAGFAAGPAVAKVAGVWSYRGDGGAVTRRVSEQDVVTVNVTAADAFGFAAGNDVFTLLDAVEQEITSGDHAALQASLSQLDSALQRLHDQQATVGAATNRVDSALQRNGEIRLALRGELATVEDVDVATAVMELQVQEVAYQATLAALSRVLQPSLVEFLR